MIGLRPFSERDFVPREELSFLGLLSFIKGMKIEDNCPIDVTFRTSRSSGFLGASVLISGVALGTQLYLKNPLFCFFNLVWLATILGALFLSFVGLLISTYRKCVIVSRRYTKIEVLESSLFCRKRATYHFAEITHIELSHVKECLLSNRCCFWTVKIHLRRHNLLESARLFESLETDKAEEAAHLLSQILGRPVLRPDECRNPDAPALDTGFRPGRAVVRYDATGPRVSSGASRRFS